MKNRTLIESLADGVEAVSWERLPKGVQKKLKICIKDGLECCLANKKDARGRAALSSLTRQSGTSTLILEKQKATAEEAAFYNTVKGSLTSRNDSSRTAICHPGAIVIPAVLALAEENGASGKRVLEAVLCGYETMICLGTSLQKAHINNAFRSTALVGAFGAAFAAAKVLGLSGGQIASAGSFGCHFAGGVNEWAVSGTGEDVFQNGWGSRNGILAARLAASGALGCPTILEGKSGLLSAFGAGGCGEDIEKGLKGDYGILHIMHKPIDSCFMVQASCQAALSIALKEGFDWKKIKSVDIFVPGQAKCYPGCDNIKIETYVQGIMSIQLGTASTLVNRSCESIQWEPPFSDGVKEVLQKCRVYGDGNMTQSFPRQQGSRVEVRMEDGSADCCFVEDVRPLTREEVEERFRRTAAMALGAEKAKELDGMLDRLEQQKHIIPIMEIMA